jgi:putative transcriptional regulator
MTYSIDFSVATSQQIEAALCARVKEIRLAKNISQLQLANNAGVSRATIERLEHGAGVSLDTFLRILIALNAQAGLQILLPDLSIRPIERVRMAGKERKRSFPKKPRHNKKEWTWGEKGNLG